MKNQQSSFRDIPFGITIILIIIMAAATIIEKINGSEFVYNKIYGTWWFVYIWALLAALSIIGIVKGHIYRNKPLLFIHLSLIVILIGALCTKTGAEQGRITVTKNVYSGILQGDEKAYMLPFSVKLDTFFISYYPGTEAPADYTSQITIREKSGETTQAQVSMNKIYKYKGYRFYQSSYENDKETSFLRINHDRLGVTVSYIGYFMFMLAMLWLLLAKGNIYRNLFKHPLLKKTAMLLIGLFSITAAYSQAIIPSGLSVEKKQADAFGNLWLLNEGRIKPVFSFASDFTKKITGETKYQELDATQFLMGIMFFYEKWENTPLFEIKEKALRTELNVKGSKATIHDFYDYNGNYILSKYWQQLSSDKEKDPLLKEVEKLNDKILLIEMVRTKRLLQIFPQNVNGNLQWTYPVKDADSINQSSFANTALTDYYHMLTIGNETGALNIIEQIKSFQTDNAGNVLPSQTHMNAERFYLKANITSWLFKINITLGILTLLLLLLAKNYKKYFTISYIILLVGFAALTVSIGLRTYIAGRLPFSNGYETMLLIAWCAMLVPTILGRKIDILVPLGFILSGFTLLVAHISMMNPNITPLVPVLSSPLLSIHVSVIMIAYTLLGFVALNSIITFIQLLLCKKDDKQTIADTLERNKIYSLICIYPAVFLLGTGIFIGAIWANASWGRYWGWDPKEVWALITFITYSLVFHKRAKISSPFSFHAFGLLAFLTVLMTYFGVNYILGGIHSYAGDSQFSNIIVISVVGIAVIAVFLAVSYFKYRKIKELYVSN